MSKKIINITAAAMALAVTLSGCATSVVQERKDQAAAAASAEAAQAAATATPEPTAEPTPEPINAWSLLSNLPDFTPGTLDNPCLLYTSPSPRDLSTSRMPSSA